MSVKSGIEKPGINLMKADKRGLRVADAYISDCIAIVEYWDAEGKICSSQVTEGTGWTIVAAGNGDNNGNSVSIAGGVIRWHAENDNTGISFIIEAEPLTGDLYDSFIIRMPADSLKEKGSCLLKTIQVMPGLISGHEGDGSEFILPVDNGVICRTRRKLQAIYRMPIYQPFTYSPLCNMPLFSVIHDIKTAGTGNKATAAALSSNAPPAANKSALVAIIEGGVFDAYLYMMTNWEGRYSANAVFSVRDFRDDAPLGEDISLRYKLLEGKDVSWREIGYYYRKYNREVLNLPTLKEKMVGNQTLEYAAKALCLRCRMGVKQIPTPILEQTPDNQPPLKVYMTFENIREIIDELIKQGVGPTEICLVGWNYSGHDGAFPQLFPVEEKFGGEKQLVKTIEHSHEKGYPLSLYDNYHDAYSLANNFDPDYVALQHGGTKAMNAKYAGGQAYVLCGRCAYEKYAVNSIRQTAALKIKGTYYIDELTLLSPRKCYNSRHPMTRRDNIAWWKKIMGEAQRQFGSSHSEGGRAWAFPETDRVYCIASRPDTTAPFMDESIPLYQVAYHGSVIYNTFRSAVNTFPGDETYLVNLSYGSLPIVYYHHIFNPAWSAADGLAHDLPFGGAEKTKKDVALLKKMTDDISRISHLMTEFMDDYIKHAPGITETVFSNGESVFVNCTDKAFEIKLEEKAITIPAYDFIVTRKI